MKYQNIRQFNKFYPKISDSVFIDPMSCIIGQVTIGEHSSIWPMVVVRGDLEAITIGERTNIQDGSILHTTRKSKKSPHGFPLIIGNDVTVGHSVTLHGCTIKDRVLIGMNSVILDGSIINSDIIIGAGSLVTSNKNLKSGYLYIGNPIKKIRKLTLNEIQFLVESSENYINSKNEHIKMMSNI